MPSEKLRYLNRISGPKPPIEFEELRNSTALLESKHLAEILCTRAQWDDVLRKVLTVATILHAGLDFERVKAVVDYALHFPAFIRYCEKGHGQILDELQAALEIAAKGHPESAIELGEYVINRATEVAECFEDDWGWRRSLGDLARYVEKLKGANSGGKIKS